MHPYAVFARTERSLRPGAETVREGTVFRVWSPPSGRMEVVIGDGARRRIVPLARERGGYFSALVRGAGPGDRYMFRLDGVRDRPDPCSRFQPEGPFGPSEIVDPSRYGWGDSAWKGLRLRGQILYELHVGAFTSAGTFASAAARLPGLAKLGITALELLPVNEFSGRWNWGYDGVDIFAPSRAYGTPDSFRAFVDTAHRLGIGVILDVVYNHMGSDGCFLQEFSPAYFSGTYATEWGRAVNFDGPGSDAVRAFFVQNACHWIREYHLDGLRIDATQDIHDAGRRHVLSDITEACRRSAGGRRIVMVAENEPQDTRCLAPVSRGGFGFDAVWDDDFHHSLRVAATGFREAYFCDYRGSPQELVSAARRGFLFQGQRSLWQRKARGTRVRAEPACSFVVYFQNHDQIGNHIEGKRVNTLIPPSRYRCLMTFLMVSPFTPMFFMGQEFCASSPFPFFADIPRLSREIFAGRLAYLSQFPSYARPQRLKRFPHPCRESTFRSACLDPGERLRHAADLRFHRALVTLRKKDPVIGLQERGAVDGAVLGPYAFALRFNGGRRGERLLLVNYGPRLLFAPAPEPLLSAGRNGRWKRVFSSDAREFGGKGRSGRINFARLEIPAGTAALFSLQSEGTWST